MAPNDAAGPAINPVRFQLLPKLPDSGGRVGADRGSWPVGGGVGISDSPFESHSQLSRKRRFCARLLVLACNPRGRAQGQLDAKPTALAATGKSGEFRM